MSEPTNDLVTALRTNGSVREFEPRAVPDDVLYRVLDTARFAPSGGNRQPWGAIFIRDRDTRVKLRELVQGSFREYQAHQRAGVVAFSTGADGIWHGPAIDLDEARRTPAPWGFVDRFEDLPEWVIITADLTQLAIMDNPIGRQSICGGASVYPFVQSMLLAARAEGIAGVLTTFLVREERAAREILGFPEHIAIAAMVLLGYPKHQNSKLTRKPVEDFARMERWDGPAFTG
ncbi:MAG: nitroreductase family protein [Acidimicrobiia bacterium]